MIYLLVHHEVADYPTWKSVFDSSLDWRTRNGERNCRIFRGVQNPNELTLLFEWEDYDKARTFMASDELKTRMGKAGVKASPKSNTSPKCSASGAAPPTDNRRRRGRLIALRRTASSLPYRFLRN